MSSSRPNRTNGRTKRQIRVDLPEFRLYMTNLFPNIEPTSKEKKNNSKIIIVEKLTETYSGYDIAFVVASPLDRWQV